MVGKGGTLLLSFSEVDFLLLVGVDSMCVFSVWELNVNMFSAVGVWSVELEISVEISM